MPEFSFIIKGFKRKKDQSRRSTTSTGSSGQLVTPGTAHSPIDPGVSKRSSGGYSIGDPFNASIYTQSDRDAIAASPTTDPNPTPKVPADLIDIVSSISKATDLRDPLKATSEALKKVLETAKSMNTLGEEWESPLRRLLFHHNTLTSQNKHLDDDFQIDQTPPPSEATVIQPLEVFARGLNKVYQLLRENEIADALLVNEDGEGYASDESITKTIAYMDRKFEEYTDALHAFASQSIVQVRSEQPQKNPEFPLDAQQRKQKVPNVYGVQHVPCLSGTREKTLAAISKWAEEETNPKPIFLLLDVAGSGKSTVAKHMANQWRQEQRLVARFFFSRDTTTTMSTKSFCSTVSNAFASISPELEESINRFQGRRDFSLLSFEELFNGLVINPLEEFKRDAILIIDALDECDNERGELDELLDVLRGQKASSTRLRILATGRPELNIKEWALLSGVEHTNFIQLEGGQKDVELYIQHRLQHRPYLQNRLYHVIKHAEGVFIWARIACDLILQTADVDRLLEELGKKVTLAFLYQTALEQSIPKDEPSRQAFTVVLQMILAAREPLSIAEFEKLSPKPGVVEGVVTRLGALLLYKDRESPIRLLHATFREFLTSREIAGSFFIQPEHGNQTLTLGCLNFISDYSSKDDHTLRNLDIISQRTYTYSSKSWVYHCAASYRKLALNRPILQFAYGGLKTWADLADKWYDLDTLDCLRDVLVLSQQNMSPKITEAIVFYGLETIDTKIRTSIYSPVGSIRSSLSSSGSLGPSFRRKLRERIGVRRVEGEPRLVPREWDEELKKKFEDLKAALPQYT